MAQSTLEELLTAKPRETSGPRTGNRSDFQKSWAFCLLLKLHRGTEDYALLLDFHDDVLVLDSATKPSGVDFYQVKTKRSGNWSVSLLLKREKGKGKMPSNSIAGKMLANKLSFPNLTKSLNFVSNAQFKVQLAQGCKKEEVSSFEVSSLCEASVNEFSRALMHEYSLDSCPLAGLKMAFKSDSLSLDDRVTHSQGQLGCFLNELQPEGKFAVPVAYSAIATTLAMRTNSETIPKTASELLKRKGMTRSEFDEILKTIVSARDDKARWGGVQAFLLKESRTFGEITTWQAFWEKYAVERMDPTNKVLKKVREELKAAIKNHFGIFPTTSLTDLIHSCLASIRNSTKLRRIPYDDNYLTAMILLELL